MYYTTDVKLVNQKKIGILTLNGAWLCCDEKIRPDNGELIFPIHILMEAVGKLKNCDFRVALIHHPPEYFKDSNGFELQDISYSKFNLLLLGHLHREYIETQYKANNGIFCNTTRASLCDDGGEIGFAIINVDLEEMDQINLQRFLYLPSENKFLANESIVIHVPHGAEKENQNNIRKKITSKFQFEIEGLNSIQAGNLYLRSQGTTNLYRDSHMSLPFSSDKVEDIPDYLK